MELAQVLADTKRIVNDIEFYTNVNTMLNCFGLAPISVETTGTDARIFSGELSISGKIETVGEGENKLTSPNYIVFFTQSDRGCFINKILGRQSNYQI